MTTTTSPRLGVPRWSANDDNWPARPGWDAIMGILESKAAIDSQDTFANRPAAGVRGRYFWATDTERLYRDTGAAWKEIGPVGGAGAGGALTFGGAGVEGSSARAARADHTHTLPAHDNAAHSGIKLNALGVPDGNVLMNGQRLVALGAPSVATDGARQADVNTGVAQAKAYADTVGESVAALISTFPTKFAWGTATVSLNNENVDDVAVTFPVGRFSQAPRILTSPVGSTTFISGFNTATATGCRIAARQYQNTAVTADVSVVWLAWQ